MIDKEAAGQLRDVVRRLLRDSIADQLYEKALACILALRSRCVAEAEPAEVNAFLNLSGPPQCEWRRDGGRAAAESRRVPPSSLPPRWRRAFVPPTLAARVTLITDAE
eukprot:gene5379-7983_t